MVNREVGEGEGRQRGTDHLKTTSCNSLMAYCYESLDFVRLCSPGIVS